MLTYIFAAVIFAVAIYMLIRTGLHRFWQRRYLVRKQISEGHHGQLRHHPLSALSHAQPRAIRTARRGRQMRPLSPAAFHRTSDQSRCRAFRAPRRCRRSAVVGRFLGDLVRTLPRHGAGVRSRGRRIRTAAALRQGRHRRRAGSSPPVITIQAIPTMVLMRGGREVARHSAAPCRRVRCAPGSTSISPRRALSLQIESIGALIFWWSMIPRAKPEGMLFGKPVSTFPDHALARGGAGSSRRHFDLADIENFHHDFLVIRLGRAGCGPCARSISRTPLWPHGPSVRSTPN